AAAQRGQRRLFRQRSQLLSGVIASAQVRAEGVGRTAAALQRLRGAAAAFRLKHALRGASVPLANALRDGVRRRVGRGREVRANSSFPSNRRSPMNKQKKGGQEHPSPKKQAPLPRLRRPVIHPHAAFVAVNESRLAQDAQVVANSWLV